MMIKDRHIELPKRLQQALISLDELQNKAIYFASIRHHSPACAYAVQKLITDIKPTHVLIEAPASFYPKLTELIDPNTKPPIAILCQTQVTAIDSDLVNPSADLANSLTHSVFYPFCQYSPEWQAIMLANAQGAKIQFIDLPVYEQMQNKMAPQQGQSLLNEHYLQHSEYINQLASRLYCRDHDEVWEHLFELRQAANIADWANFFRDTLCWCSMARLDYEAEAFITDDSKQRELHMITAIGQLKQTQPDAKIVVVTGGFHTLALIEGLWQKKLCRPTKSMLANFTKQQQHIDQDQTWLIRYSFDRLDALNGYAAGMKSPAYYQQFWLSLLKQDADNALSASSHYRQTSAIQFLAKIADELRQSQLIDIDTGFVALKTSVSQAYLLAELRDHAGPGRYDLLDGLQSGFIKNSTDQLTSDFWQKIQRLFSGNELGDIPATSQLPPLINEVYSTLQKYRFKLNDTLPKLTHLDIYRKPAHQQRSRFLHLLHYLDIGFAHRIDGPDYINGKRLSILFEDWQYAWTPLVEARLIELSMLGGQIKQLALSQLQQDIDALANEGRSNSSIHVAQCITQAALIGLQTYLPQLFAKLTIHIEMDSELSSIVACGHRLLYLWQGRDFLALNDMQSTFLALLDDVIKHACFQLDQLKQQDIDQQQRNLTTLLSLRELLNNLPDSLPKKQRQQDFYLNLMRLKPSLSVQSFIRGGIDSISYLDGVISQAELEQNISIEFGVGADNEQAVNYFMAMMSCAPELIVQSSLLVTHINTLLMNWSSEQFIAILPDLRYAFSQLSPKQTLFIAKRIASQHDINETELSMQQNKFSVTQANRALTLEQFLHDDIKHNLLQQWFNQ